ncbi:DNA polymerase III subunit delta [candidate division WOR-3 bacterium]|nr:DNA polymerase III subunit delta [candidate division WOR-3 bacterium]
MVRTTARAAAASVLQEIEAGRLRRLYLLFGSDPVLAEEVVAGLKKQAVAPGLEAFDLEVVHATDIGGDRLAVPELLQHTRQPPMGSPRRLVVVRDLELLDKRLGRELCRGLADVPDSSVVAVTCEYDKAWAGIFSEAGLSQYVFATGTPAGEELDRMIARWAAARRLKLDAAAVAALRDCAGDETALLKGEVDKLATLYEPGTRVEAADVRRLASHTRAYELGEYVDCVADGDTGRALQVLHRLAEWDEEPVKVIGWLAHRLLRQAARMTGGRHEHLSRGLNQLYIINRSILQGHRQPYALLDLFTACMGCFGSEPCGLAARRKRPDFCLRPRPAGRTRRSTVGAD